MRMSAVLAAVLVGGLALVHAKGDLNDFNTDRASISAERVAMFYSDKVIQGEYILHFYKVISSYSR